MGRAAAWKPHTITINGRKEVFYPIDDEGRAFESESQLKDWMVKKAIWIRDNASRLGIFPEEYDEKLVKYTRDALKTDPRTAKNYIDADFKERLDKALGEKKAKREAIGRISEELPPFTDLDVVKDYMKDKHKNIALERVIASQNNFYLWCRKHPFDWSFADFENWIKERGITNRRTLFNMGKDVRQVIKQITENSATYMSDKRLLPLTNEQLSGLQAFVKGTKETYPNPPVEEHEKGATEQESYSFEEVLEMINDIAKLREEGKIVEAEELELEFLIRFLYSSGARIGSMKTKKVYGDGWSFEENPNGALNICWEWIDWEGKNTGLGKPSILMYDKGKRQTQVFWIRQGKRVEKMWTCHVWQVGFTDKALECIKALHDFYGKPSEGRIFKRLGYAKSMVLMKLLIYRLVERSMTKAGIKPSKEGIEKEVARKLQDLKEFHGLRKALVRYLVDVKGWHEEEILNYEAIVKWEDQKTLHDFYFPRHKIMEQVRKKLEELKGMI